MKKIAIVVASEMTVKAFMREHIAALAQRYSLTIIVNTEDPQFLDKLGIGAQLIGVPIARKISPFADLRALLRLGRILRNGKFDLVHSVTPKAGLIAAIAGHLAGVPRRLHTFTGQVWVTRHGAMRAMLKAADRLIARLSTHVLVDSFSQRDFLVAQGIVSLTKTSVLGQGSISGVNTARFRPDREARQRLRKGLGINEGETLFLFLGRLKRDKGVLDLARAFAASGARRPDTHLLLVGPDEENLGGQARELAGDCASRLHCSGYTDSPEDFYASADVFCLPSYREGFGSAVLEAAAAGLPSIGSRIYGITDAIVEGRTGLLFEPGNFLELADKMNSLASDPGLRARMGTQARKRALRDFPASVLTAALLDFYDRLLQVRNVS